MTQKNITSGCGSAWLERLVWDQEVAEHQPSKLDTWVRFPSPAFLKQFVLGVVRDMSL